MGVVKPDCREGQAEDRAKTGKLDNQKNDPPPPLVPEGLRDQQNSINMYCKCHMELIS